MVSVIVLNWNGKKFLEKCIYSLINQSYSCYEILLVDNGSTDNSVDFVEKTFPENVKVKCIPLAFNYGFAEGNNIGCKYATGEYVIILNNDTEVEPNFIEELVRVAQSDQKIGSVGCRIAQYDGKVGYTPLFTNKGFIVPFFLGGSTAENRLDAVCSVPSCVLANCGCAVLFRKDLFELVGGFDKDFWSDWEDHDIGIRINIAGFKCVYTPKTTVLHRCGGSGGFTKNRRTRLYKNMLFTYIKNFEMKTITLNFSCLFYFILPLGHFAWILFNEHNNFKKTALHYDRKSYFSILEAYLRFLRGLPLFVKKRQEIQRLRKVSDTLIFRQTSMPCLA